MIYLSRKNKIKVNYDSIRLESIRNNVLLIGPRTLTVDITDRCNYRCKFCIPHGPYDNKARESVYTRDSVPFKELKNIFAQAYTLGVECINICGDGEPLLHPRIIDILLHLKTYDFRVIVFTNASISEAVKRIVQLPAFNLSFMVNFSAVGPQQYSYIHGQPATRFNKVLENIRALNKAFPVTLNYLIFEDTEHDLRVYLQLSHSLGVKKIILKFPNLYNFEQKKMLLSREAVVRFLSKFKKMEQVAREYGISLDYQRYLLNLCFQSCGKKKVKKCYQGWLFGHVKVNGNLYFCCSENKPLGRLRNGDFSKAYFSRRSLEYLIEGKKTVDVTSPKWRKCVHCSETDTNSIIEQLV
ncbi:MAG: radical SAM protein [Candidatus Firestonebacteria bacterium]